MAKRIDVNPCAIRQAKIATFKKTEFQLIKLNQGVNMFYSFNPSDLIRGIHKKQMSRNNMYRDNTHSYRQNLSYSDDEEPSVVDLAFREGENGKNVFFVKNRSGSQLQRELTDEEVLEMYAAEKREDEKIGNTISAFAEGRLRSLGGDDFVDYGKAILEDPDNSVINGAVCLSSKINPYYYIYPDEEEYCPKYRYNISPEGKNDQTRRIAGLAMKNRAKFYRKAYQNPRLDKSREDMIRWGISRNIEDFY